MTKKIIKIMLIINIAIIMLLNCNLSFAGMADFDDNAAAQQTQNLLQEQEKEENTVVGKSSNNYLSELSIKGYELTPAFDKQIHEYSITEVVDVDEINIIAVTDDSRAIINGKGIVKLQPGENNLRIDVEAESGTVRTYFIKITKSNNENNEENMNNIAEENTVSTSTNVLDDSNTQLEQKKSSDMVTLIIIIVIIILLFILLKKPKKKKKNRYK